METAAAIEIGRKVVKVADKVLKYLKEDNSHSYGLDEEVSVLLSGKDVAWPASSAVSLADYTTQDGSLTIAFCETSLDVAVRLVAHPFPVSSNLWNGPDIISDTKFRAMAASLFHDLIWEHASELAKAWGVSKTDVLGWGDGVLYAVWMWASEDTLLGRIEARVAWSVCEFSKGWYHTAKKWLGLHTIALATLLAAAGCVGTPPDWQVVEFTGTNAIIRAMGGEQTVEAEPETISTTAPSQEKEASGAGAGETSVTPAAHGDAVDFSSLEWAYGGFKGGGAKPVNGVEIGSLKVSGNLTYKWVAGGCEKLGATSREDAGHTICALFVRNGGRWKGGKFDWISTSRTSRDLKNIKSGYNGWPRDAVDKAEAFAFVIVSEDGKKRSNVAYAQK